MTMPRTLSEVEALTQERSAILIRVRREVDRLRAVEARLEAIEAEQLVLHPPVDDDEPISTPEATSRNVRELLAVLEARGA